MLSERRLRTGVTEAVRHFWNTRAGQAKKQVDSGRSDQGARGAVTGGKQMDGFVSLVRHVITEAGISSNCITLTPVSNCRASFARKRNGIWWLCKAMHLWQRSNSSLK